MLIDQVYFQRQPGQLSYAMNANLQSKDGFGITYTNEMSNQLCVTFPEGFRVIGVHTILERNEVIFALVNTSTGKSEIGKVTNFNCNNLTVTNVETNCSCIQGKDLSSTVDVLDSCCTYTPIVQDNACLNFNIDYPVRMAHKLTNCGFSLYFTDDFNEPRYIDLNLDPTSSSPFGLDSCQDPLTEDDWCGMIKIFKDFCIPKIEPETVEGGGNLPAGVIQGLIAYTDIKGQEYTDYFEATNPVHIFDRFVTIDTDYLTNKSVKFRITHSTDLFEYFKLVIIQTVNEVSDYIEAGVFKVSPVNTVTYTGNNKSLPRTSLEKLRIPKPSYTKAKFIEESSDHLMLADLEADPDYNLQPFASQLQLFWETVEVPYDQLNNYFNPIVASRFRSYMRDEVYPFAIRFKLKNGKKTKAYHIPGRARTGISGIVGKDGVPDEAGIGILNRDNIQDVGCDDPEEKKMWQVYNTAISRGDSLPMNDETFSDPRICDITRYEYGDFAYWESTETYPCDERIWGDLAGQPIRHHKFPDSVVSHIHDSWNNKNNPNDRGPVTGNTNNQYDINHKSYIYPIGARLDESTFNTLFQTFMVFNPETQANDIPLSDIVCGFELVHGNRVGNKSVIAKGMLYDVGKVKEHKGLNPTGKEYYIPNYPYNDLREDFYLSNNRDIYDLPDQTASKESDVRLHAYDDVDTERFRRYTFHSPDTEFQHPQLGTQLKLETLEFGVQEGHFVNVDEHPRYKFLTKFDSIIAASLGALSAITIVDEGETDLGVTAGERSKGRLEFSYADFMATSNLVRDLIEKLIPLRNFAYQYHSRGVYNNYVPINNLQSRPDGTTGAKIRSLDIARYLSPNNQDVNDEHPFHNYGRESSVFFKVNHNYTNTTSNPYTRDEVSRFTLGNPPSAGEFIRPVSDWCKNPELTGETKIRSYYASMKRYVPDQYGSIDNVVYITTGYNVTLNNGIYEATYYPAFGGDTFICRDAIKRKMPFFTQNTVKKPDETHFDYDLVPNFAFPTYYIGTSPDELTLKEIVTPTDAALIVGGLAALIVANALPGIAAKIGNLAAMAAFGIAGFDIYMHILNAFIVKNNLDCDTTPTKEAFDPNSLGDIAGTLQQGTFFYQSGKFYLANYGIPNYFVETDINLELRHARNLLEENFYPNVGTGIPDEWLQEKNVPILHDNKFNYNATYSMQNYQEFIEPFNNYNFDKICQSDFPNRVIYSEKSNNEENFDNWLKYGANNYFDFDKSAGDMVGIHGIDNNKLLARFENTFMVFNTTITIPSNTPTDIQVGNSGIFGAPPMEFTKTYTGHGGSQHVAFEKTKIGSFWVDARRGEVFRFTDRPEEISRPNYNWFKENLPFSILKDFPDINIDNAFKDIGISVCWDERFERLFITKLDYELLPEWRDIVFHNDDGFFRNVDDTVIGVSLEDPEFFANKSWTIAWSPLINNWVSFYSFLPNYYVSHPTHFQTGIHDTLWNHNLSNLSYQVYYNTLYPYILEFPLSNLPQSEILKSVAVNNETLKYVSETDYYSLKSVNTENYNVFFNKAIIYNREQCSGTLTLTETPINNMQARMGYPVFNADNINILFSKNDNWCTFNGFFDVTKNYNNGQPIFTREWSSLQAQYPIDKVLNLDDLNYVNNAKKVPIRSNECYVRLIQDVHQRYKFVNILAVGSQEQFKNQRK